MMLVRNQKGFSHIVIFLVLIVVVLIGFIGWQVYSKNKSPTVAKTESSPPKSVDKPKVVAEKNDKDYSAPKGWIQFKRSPLSFYYPQEWKAEEFKITIHDKYAHIPGGYGTPVGYIFDKDQNKWMGYTNYGHEMQKPLQKSDGADYLENITIPSVSESPVAFFEMGHASYVSHEILVSHKESAYRIRLPGVNGMTENGSVPQEEFDAKKAAETNALPEIIKSIRFADENSNGSSVMR